MKTAHTLHCVLYEWNLKKDNADCLARHTEKFYVLRKMAKDFLENSNTNIGLSWENAKGNRVSDKTKESSIISICLTEALKDWKNKKDIIKKQVLAITNYFLSELTQSEA